MVELIRSALQDWNSFYANHAAVRTVTDFLHIGGLLVGGGLAISADRMTLRAARRSATEKVWQLEVLRAMRCIVLFSFAAVAISGLMLFAADVDTFVHSVFFWIKMALVAGLLINGSLIIHAERLAASDAARGWRNLTITSTVSVALWLLTTLAGAVLPNVG